MKSIPQLIEWSERALSLEQQKLRQAERTACMIRNLLKLRYSVSAAILFIAAEAFRCDLWHTSEDDFESFELWLEFVFNGTNVKRGSTLWTIANSFATGLAPWLREKEIQDEQGEITPERVLEDAGYSLLQDVNTAWWGEYKNESPEADQIIESVTREIIKPETTRESIDTWLVEEGHRKRQQEKSYQYAEQPCSDGTALVIMCPTGQDLDFVKGKLERWLAMFPGRLQEVSPELIFVGAWGVEMIQEGEK